MSDDRREGGDGDRDGGGNGGRRGVRQTRDSDTVEGDSGTATGEASESQKSKPRPRIESVQDTLGRIRHRRRPHVTALIAVAVVGLLLVWLHWFGLIIAGALVGVVSPSLRSAVVSALGFGVLVLAVFVLTNGAGAQRVVIMAPIIYITAAGALVLPVLGSLVRGVESSD